MQKYIAAAVVSFVVMLNTAHARVFDITPVGNSADINEITNSGYGIINYTVKNVSLNPVNNIQVVDIPSANNGITQIIQNSQCGMTPVTFNSSTDCGQSFSLATGMQCNLKLCIAGPNMGAIGTTVTAGPEICSNGEVSGPNCSIPALESDRISIKVIDTTTAPSFSVSPSPATFIPGQTATWTIHNPSLTQTLYQIMPQFSGTVFGPYMTNINTAQCQTLAPNANCTISATISPSTPSLPLTNVPFMGTNTQTTQVGIQIDSINAILSATSVTFTNPSIQQTINVTNNSSDPVTGITPTLPAGITLVANNCSGTLAAGATCGIILQASVNSFGSGNFTLAYNVLGFPAVQTFINVITVQNTTISINNNNPIKLAEVADAQVFPISNSGNFNLQSMLITLTTLPHVSFDATACPAVLAVGSSCNVKFVVDTTQPATPTVATLSVAGNSSSTPIASQTVTVSNLTISTDPTFTHLQYTRVNIGNNTGSGVILNAPSIPANLSTQVKVCLNSDATTCDYTSTCIAGSTLPASGSCNWVFKALDSTTQTLGNINGQVGVSVTSGSTTWQELFSTTQSTQVYATGSFTQAGSTTVSNIAAWNGTNWVALGGPSGTGIFGGPGRSLAIFGGDLYVGGGFTSFLTTSSGSVSTNYIASWNGANFNTVGNQTLQLGPAATTIYGLASNGKTLASGAGMLYMGGSFTQIGPVANNALRLAAWNGGAIPQIQPLPAPTGPNNIVYSLFYDATANSLYFGGAFTAAAPISTSFISLFNTGTNTFAGFGTGAFPLTQVNSIAKSGGNIYAAGIGVTNRSANSSGTAWTPHTVANNTIQSLNIDTTGAIYGGGLFTTPATGIGQLIANAWTALTNSPNLGTLYSLYSYPNQPSSPSPILYAAGTIPTLNNIAYQASPGVWMPLGGGLTFPSGAPAVYAVLIAPSISMTPVVGP